MRQTVKSLFFALFALFMVGAAPIEKAPSEKKETAVFFAPKKSETPPKKSEKLTPEKLKEHVEKKAPAPHVDKSKSFVINYRDVDIKEIIRFVSKIADLNFSYDESKLDFKVTMVSEGPAHITDILSTFVQLLRIHGMAVVSGDGMLLICEAGETNSPAPLIHDMKEFACFEKTPLATRLFYVDNIGAAAALNLIKPMLSPSAIIEASADTYTLVVTDTPANLKVLDEYTVLLNHPSHPNEIALFRVKHHFASAIAQIAQKVLGPVAGKTPLLLLPQQNSNAVLIISSPFLIQKSLAVLEKLDSSPVSFKNTSPKGIEHENVFVYSPKHKSGPELVGMLKKIGSEVRQDQLVNQDLDQAVASARWIPETGAVLVIGDKEALTKVSQILSEVDIDASSSGGARTFLVYTPQHLSFLQLGDALKNFVSGAGKSAQTDPALTNAVKTAYSDPTTGSITFAGTRDTLAEVSKLLSSIDSENTQMHFERKFFLYKPKFRSPHEVLSALRQVSDALKDAKVIDSEVTAAISHAKIVSEKQALLITAHEKALDQIKALLKNIDAASNANQDVSSRYLIYQIKVVSEKNLIDSLDQIAVKLQSSADPDEDLVRAIKHLKYVPQTHALVFTGEPTTIKNITEILGRLDVGDADAAPSSFLAYKPNFLNPKQLLSEIKQYTERLRSSGLDNPELLTALQSATISDKSGTLVVAGNKAVIAEVEEILKTLDSPEGGSSTDILIYKVQHVSPEELLAYLAEASEHLSSNEESSIMSAIRSAKIFRAADSIAFAGSKYALSRIQSMINKLDTESKHSSPTGMFIYQPKNLSQKELDKSLDQLVHQFSQQSDQQPMVHLLETRHWNDQAGAFIFSGDQQAIEKLKTLLATMDNGKTGVTTTVYTLQHVSLEDALAYIQNLEKNDPASNILEVLKGAKGVAHSRSIILRGQAGAVSHVESMLKGYDTEANAPTTAEGKTAFVLYHPKYVDGDALIGHLKKMAEDLTHSGLTDTPLIRTLSQAKWNAASKGILLTGTADSIKRVQGMLEQFDVPISQGENRDHSSFWIYHPSFVPVDQLANWVKTTRQNLKNSGLSDPGLFAALDSMRISEADRSITFSGAPASLSKIKDLITHYDNEFNTDRQRVKVGGMVFLLYKLQHHQGQEIMKALQNIGGLYRSFAKNGDQDSSHLDQDLIDTISSMQWLSMTNSILCSGSANALDKIQALITKLDVPLQQVFLEVLVINTSLTESLNFGIRWGGAGNLSGKAISSMGLFPSVSSDTNAMNSFGATIQGAGSKALPPLTSFGTGGFDFGVIGDVISHGAKTYLTLGSLANALQTDSNSAIILNPKIIAQDNQQAHIFSGSNRPFSVATFTQTNSNNTSASTATSDYRDIGFDMKITPVIGTNEIITLIIDQDFSELESPGGPAADDTSTANNTVTKQTTTTRVHVPNNHFVALSGMLRDTRQRSRVGIPCLGGLPVIGAAFANTNKNNQKTNTIIFIRPQVVNSQQQLTDMTDRIEDQFRDHAGALELRYDIDDAIDMVQLDDIDEPAR